MQATLYIQKWFRKFKNRNIWFDVIRKYREAVKKIQRLVRDKILNTSDREMYRIKRNLSIFDQMKVRVYTDSQIKIAYHWRKFKKAIDLKKAQ